MKKIALIVNNKIHNLFESEDIPHWPPYPDGTTPLLVDMTGKEVDEGWDYDLATGIATEPEPVVYEMSQDEKDSMHSNQNLSRVETLLENLLSIESRAKAEIDPKYAEERTHKISSLLEVRAQPNWPVEVEWPDWVLALYPSQPEEPVEEEDIK